MSDGFRQQATTSARRELNEELTRALGVLESHGLVGRVMAGGITAGTCLREASPGIRVFENVFSLRELPRGWAFQPGGPMNLASEVHLDTLDGAVAAAIAWTAKLQTAR